jgi:hypothetical protein
MIEQSGSTYTGSNFAKSLFVAEPKTGKSVFLVSQLLGVFPGQKFGGVVDKPENLHVFAFDESALVGIDKFLMESCKVTDKNILNYRAYNFQDDCRRVALGTGDYDMSLYNSVIGALAKVKDRVRQGGVHALVISSLTGLTQAVQRGLFGPPNDSRGQADLNKWSKFAQLVSEIRNYCQVDMWHCFFEGHLVKKNKNGEKEDSLAIQGSAGDNFSYNVGQVFRVRRMPGQKVQGYNVDQAYIDTQPILDFVAGGRGFNEKLQARENDLTAVLMKLGMKVGQYGFKQNT